MRQGVKTSNRCLYLFSWRGRCFNALVQRILPEPESVSAFSILFVFLFLTGIGFFAGHALAAENPPGELKITRITPSGMDVPAGRQIVFEFNRPVVPLGRMERNSSEIPITIEPALSCQWRWLNASNLACQLDEKNGHDACNPLQNNRQARNQTGRRARSFSKRSPTLS